MIKRYGRYIFEFGEQFNRLTCLGDSIDNSYGKTRKSRSVPCCGICNRMKSNLDLDVFINHVNKIKSHILNSSNYDKECENEVSRTA